MRRDARSKRFKCPRCITYSHGNPVNFHEHVANECRAPWPTSVPAVAESKTAIRLRKPVAQASAPKAAPSAATSEGGAAAEPSEASDDDDLEDDSEEEEEDEQSVAAPSVSEAGPSGTSPFVQASTPAPPTVPHAAIIAPAVTPAALASSVAPVQAPAEPSAEPSPNVAVVAPVADVEASPSQDAAAVEAAAAPVKVELEETLPSTAPSAPVAAAPTNARGMVPRSTSSRSLRAKPKKVLKDWGSDDDDMFLASAGEDDDSDADEHVPSGQSKRKKRASTAASDGNRVRPRSSCPLAPSLADLVLLPSFLRSPASTFCRRVSSRRGRSPAVSARRRSRSRTRASRRWCVAPSFSLAVRVASSLTSGTLR